MTSAIKTNRSKMSGKSSKLGRLSNYLFFEHPSLLLFQLVCGVGCCWQLFSVFTKFLQFENVVEIEIDSRDYTYLPSISISNDFFMFLNMTKVDEEFKEWANLSTLVKTRKFLSLQNLTSAHKFEFLYDKKVLFENCTVFDIYSTNVTKEEVAEYELLSEEFKSKIVSKEEFANIDLSDSTFKPPYLQSKKCLEIADIYLRTEYKDYTGWSDQLWYMTLFYRPADQINTDRFKYTKMGNELLMSLRWELLSGVQEDIEFGFKIHFHAPDMAPNNKRAATLGINGRAARWFTLGYTHSLANFLKPPYRSNCYDYTEYNFTSRQDCIDTCMIELSRKHCNTLPLFTLMQTETTANFKYKKRNAECIYKFNILLYCEQKCYRKDCSADFFSAAILSEVSQSQKTLIIDIVKPNSGINEEFNYKQSMKPFELFLYVGSTLSLWFGISVYGLSMYLEKYLGKSGRRQSASRLSLLKRARRLLKRPFKVRSSRTMSNKTMASTLSNYRNANGLEATKFREKLGVNYRQNIDINYMQNIGQYSGLYSGDQLYKI